MVNNILDNIRGSKSVLIAGHVRPDGDCIGACLAMREYCRISGIADVDIAVPSNITDYYRFIPGVEYFNELHHSHYDLMIVLDCASPDRFNRLDVFFKSAKKTICIDHHVGHNGFAKYNLVDEHASSTCELLFFLMDEKNMINEKIAYYLFVGLSADTGHFMHCNTNAKVFMVASKLASYGADVFSIAKNLNKIRSREKTALIARALSKIRYYDDNTIAIIPITEEDLKATGVQPSDSEGMIDYAVEIKDVVVGCSMCEESPGLFKVSLRSNSRDVSKIAAVFGGGGHVAAAGCKINGDTETAISRLLDAIRSNC